MAALIFQVITTSKYHVIPPIQGNFNFNNNYALLHRGDLCCKTGEELSLMLRQENRHYE